MPLFCRRDPEQRGGIYISRHHSAIPLLPGAAVDEASSSVSTMCRRLLRSTSDQSLLPRTAVSYASCAATPFCDNFSLIFTGTCRSVKAAPVTDEVCHQLPAKPTPLQLIKTLHSEYGTWLLVSLCDLSASKLKPLEKKSRKYHLITQQVHGKSAHCCQGTA